MTSNSYTAHTQCVRCFTAINCCQCYVGQSEGHGFRYATNGKDAFDGGRQAGQLYQLLEGVNNK